MCNEALTGLSQRKMRSGVGLIVNTCRISGDHLIQRIAHDETQFSVDNPKEEDTDSGLDSAGLEVDFDQANPSRPIEAPPSLEKSKHALAARRLSHDASTESTVEGYDSLVRLWELRRLHPLESHGCRKEDQDFDGEGNGTNNEHVVQDDNAAFLGKLSPALGVFDVPPQAEVQEEHPRHLDGELMSGGPQCHGRHGLACALEAGQTLPPALWRVLRDHDMGPGHIDAS